MITVSKIITYPFKSAKGIELPHTQFDAEGMLNDRRLMAVDEHGSFLTARTQPELLQVNCEPTATGWTVSHPKISSTVLISSNSTKVLTGDVWEDLIQALDAGDEAAEWISELLQIKSRIAIWKPQARHSRKYDLETSFADAAPLLVASEASMKQGCEWGGIGYDYRRFRPNIIISGVDAFEEENWSSIKIGTATFEMLDTCTRCIMVTRDPDNGEAHNKQQPLRALVKQHTDNTKHPIMGVNAKLTSPIDSAKIAINDTVTLL